MSVHLVGGGWSEEHRRSVYGPFVEESSALAHHRSRATAQVAVVQLFDSSVEDGAAKFGQFATILDQLGDCRAVPFLVAEGETLPVGVIDGVDGLLVAGGPTPAYHAALVPVAAELRELVGHGVPYLGFSAGAAIAADTAIIGGWRHGDLVIAPQGSGEDLDQLTIVPGLGLVDFAVDVHAAQWGTLARAMAAVRLDAVEEAVAIDEDTVCTVGDRSTTVAGAGSIWWVTKGQSAVVTVRTAEHSTVDRGTLRA
jgi:cyanophycinase